MMVIKNSRNNVSQTVDGFLSDSIWVLKSREILGWKLWEEGACYRGDKVNNPPKLIETAQDLFENLQVNNHR